MSRRRLALAAAALGALPAALVLTPAAASAEGTTCVPYTETTGACITQWYGDDGALHTILSFYWGNSYVDIPLA